MKTLGYHNKKIIKKVAQHSWYNAQTSEVRTTAPNNKFIFAMLALHTSVLFEHGVKV
jgi:hypothetical protein